MLPKSFIIRNSEVHHVNVDYS